MKRSGMIKAFSYFSVIEENENGVIVPLKEHWDPGDKKFLDFSYNCNALQFRRRSMLMRVYDRSLQFYSD